MREHSPEVVQSELRESAESLLIIEQRPFAVGEVLMHVESGAGFVEERLGMNVADLFLRKQ